jgi:dipeptidyl aminopeptidase/acylaminoacyl peptidase
MWAGVLGGPNGVWYQAQTTQALLDAGFAVVTPEAHLDGAGAWDTNIAPYNVLWETSPDHLFMVDLFAAIEAGELGPLDPARLVAGGISSGGYMTSRMAVSYPGRFAALAIHSGSYATCAAALCAVPALPADHPPTLFLHGALDAVVPAWTMELYSAALEAGGASVSVVTDDFAGHEWIEAAPASITAWFTTWTE